MLKNTAASMWAVYVVAVFAVMYSNIFCYWRADFFSGVAVEKCAFVFARARFGVRFIPS